MISTPLVLGWNNQYLQCWILWCWVRRFRNYMTLGWNDQYHCGARLETDIGLEGLVLIWCWIRMINIARLKKLEQ